GGGRGGGGEARVCAARASKRIRGARGGRSIDGGKRRPSGPPAVIFPRQPTPSLTKIKIDALWVISGHRSPVLTRSKALSPDGDCCSCEILNSAKRHDIGLRSNIALEQLRRLSSLPSASASSGRVTARSPHNAR